MNTQLTTRSLRGALVLGAPLLLIPLTSFVNSAEAQIRRRSTTNYRNGRTTTGTTRRSPYSKFLRPYRNPATSYRRPYNYNYRRNQSGYNYNYNRPYNYNYGYGTGRYTTQRRYYTAPNGHIYYRTYRVYR